MDVTHPDVLGVLDVDSKDDIPGKYIEGQEECVLTEYNKEIECEKSGRGVIVRGKGA